MQQPERRGHIKVSPYTSPYPPGPNAISRSSIISLTENGIWTGWIQDFERAGTSIDTDARMVATDQKWNHVVFYPPVFRFTTVYLYVDYYVDSQSNAILEKDAHILYSRLKSHLDANPNRDFLQLAGEVFKSSPLEIKRRTMMLYKGEQDWNY